MESSMWKMGWHADRAAKLTSRTRGSCGGCARIDLRNLAATAACCSALTSAWLMLSQFSMRRGCSSSQPLSDRLQVMNGTGEGAAGGKAVQEALCAALQAPVGDVGDC
eukprot:352421-Chlamydomonas_euryale.AAC.77